MWTSLLVMKAREDPLSWRAHHRDEASLPPGASYERAARHAACNLCSRLNLLALDMCAPSRHVRLPLRSSPAVQEAMLKARAREIVGDVQIAPHILGPSIKKRGC